MGRYDDKKGSTGRSTISGTGMDSSVNQSATQNSTSTTDSSSSTSGSKSGYSNTTNMDPSSLAALELLISQLLGGGTESMLEDRAARQSELDIVQALRGQYSKDAAFADAQGAMNQYLRQAMEQMLPTLVRAAEGSGTSANSMRALLTQDALTRASEGAAALGLKAATDYGAIGTNLSSVLEQLTQTDTSAVDALIQALNVAKGSVQNTEYGETSSQTSNSSQTTNTNTTTNSNTSTDSSGSGGSGKSGGGATMYDSSSAGGGLSGYSSGGLTSLTNQQWNALAKELGSSANWFEPFANDSWASYSGF